MLGFQDINTSNSRPSLISGSASRNSSARIMPVGHESRVGIIPVPETGLAYRVHQDSPLSTRYNKRQAPSNVTAEAYLASRISLGPVFVHNEMITRIQNISNVSAHPPRFRDEIDILA